MDSGGGNSGELLDEMPPCSSDQEAPRRRSVAAMVSGCDGSGVMFDGMPQTGSRSEFDAGAGVSLWAGLQADILGVVLRFLPCLADRASVRSVCRHWRAAAQGHLLPPPLPILVLPEFKFSSLSEKGELMPVRRVPVPKEVPADGLRCVGSFDGWLVAVTPSKDCSDRFYRDADGECFLVNAFSRKVIRLPQLCNMHYNPAYYSIKILPVVNGICDVHFGANETYKLSLCQVALSDSPDSGSKYIVAANSEHKCASVLALWQPGMMLWHVCSGFDIDGPKDLAFYQGKLYVLVRFRTSLLTFELDEDDRGFMVSRVELCLRELPCNHPFQESGPVYSNMVVWRGELLLIIRYYTDEQVLKVQVFALDVNMNPCGLSEIHSFNGDCILVGSGGCKSFPAGLHGVEGDLIYFVPDDWEPYDSFVYSMRDGRMRPFAAKLLACYSKSDVPQKNLNFPVWLLPSA
ncbi:hypothetical protein BAE44_0015024 [Dichanthelium oligosanthes]|uniref:KIB1-4 beta-propeller domain-containing protein n=1 Tax=Dichanthelium oligosanthes TaxID=888268 RepID=A0A1E5VFR8_9POAL|nr:hypothetical protein BAE44_0015024 [Dichanthelium oligosanthes]